MKWNRQTVFTIVIGFMLLTWVMGTALSSNLQLAQGNGIRIESVYDRLLTPQEKVTILRSGRVLIEYLHTGGFEAVDKRATYENFVARFKDIVILEVVEIEQANQTLDQMITPTGDVVELQNVSAAELLDVFCDNSYVQPKECLLRSI
jgi:hypothetical protein